MRPGQFPLALCALSLVSTGCYTYSPIESPRPGMEVRAQLETEAAVRRSAGLDDPITRYDGMLVEVTSEEYALDVLIARSTSVFQEIEIRDTVRLPRTEVRSVLERRFSAVRTGLVTVAAAAAAAAVVLGVDAIVGGTGEDDGDPDPTAIRVPFFSLIGSKLSTAILRGGRRD